MEEPEGMKRSTSSSRELGVAQIVHVNTPLDASPAAEPPEPPGKRPLHLRVQRSTQQSVELLSRDSSALSYASAPVSGVPYDDGADDVRTPQLAPFTPVEPKKPTRGPKVLASKMADFICAPFSLLMRAVTITAASSLLSGYDQGVIAAAMLTMREDLRLNGVEEELSIGVLNIAAALGGICAGYLADAFGRKRAIAVAHVCFFVGSVLIAAAGGFAALLLGRIIQGAGVGIGLVVPPVLKAELVPAHRRGGLVSIGDVCNNFGILLGYSSGLAFYGVPAEWRYMFALGAVPAALLLCLIWSVPESPRWLVRVGREAKALRVLTAVHESAAEAAAELQQIRADLAEEATKPALSWSELLWSADVVSRRRVWRGLGVAFFSQATGTEAVVYYAAFIVQAAGVTDVRHTLLAIMGVGLCKVLFLLLGCLLFDRVGRRPLLLVSAAGLGVALLLLAAAASGERNAALAIFGLCLFMASFSIGFSPLVYVLCSEIFPSAMRARAMSVALFTTRIVAGAISSSFVSLREAATPTGAWLLFVPLSALAFLFVFLAIPETKGVALEDMPSLFDGSRGRIGGGCARTPTHRVAMPAPGAPVGAQPPKGSSVAYA